MSDKESGIEVMSTKIANANTSINELENSIKTYKFNEWIYLVVIGAFLGLTAIGFFKGFIQI